MSDGKWLEISFVVDGELAESVSEVLSRYIPDGVVIESTAVDTKDDNSAGKPIGDLKVSGYLAVDDQLEEKRQQIEEAIWYLGRIRDLPSPKYRTIEQADWSEAWKQHYHPIAIGEKLMVVPAWVDNTIKDRIPVYIDPGMAFGTGTHPTTQLCLEMMEFVLQNNFLFETKKNVMDVIDVGCGSGILSIAALKLGVDRALGVDIDVDAIQSARDNAAMNGVRESVEFGVGSLTEIEAGRFSFQRAPLVVANILAVVIIRLLDQGLGSLLEPNGKLVLSGILEEQLSDVTMALDRNGLQVVSQRQQGDWVAILVKSNV